MKCIFQTPRLFVRNFASNDWRALQQLGERLDVARMTSSIPSSWPEDEVKAWMMRGPFCGAIPYTAGVFHPEYGLVGLVGFGGEPLNLMYAIATEYWGQGFASECAFGALHHGFGELGLKVVEASHFADNPASARILTKLGFEKTGEGVGESRARLEPAPIITYRLTQQQFEAVSHEIP